MITSTGSNQVKHVVMLRKKSRTRRENREFIVEGIRMVSEVPTDRLVKIYLMESYSKDHADLIEKYDKEILEIVSDSVFIHMADTDTPQGIMAIVKMEEYTSDDVYGTDDNMSDNMSADNGNTRIPLLLFIENLQDPGNLGTIVRMGEAAGITGIVASSNTVDIYNPKTIRSTMGSIFRMPFIYVENFTAELRRAKDLGIKLYAAHLQGKKEYTELDCTLPCGFLIGNEGNGLSEAATNEADELSIIPMCGEVESLNAAIAASVLSFEAARQRR